MLKIEVTGSYIKNLTGKNGPNAGKEFNIPMVECYAHLADSKFPVRCDYSVAKGEKAPTPGMYFIGPDSFEVGGEYGGQLVVKRSLHLVAIPAKV